MLETLASTSGQTTRSRKSEGKERPDGGERHGGNPSGASCSSRRISVHRVSVRPSLLGTRRRHIWLSGFLLDAALKPEPARRRACCWAAMLDAVQGGEGWTGTREHTRLVSVPTLRLTSVRRADLESQGSGGPLTSARLRSPEEAPKSPRRHLFRTSRPSRRHPSIQEGGRCCLQRPLRAEVSTNVPSSQPTAAAGFRVSTEAEERRSGPVRHPSARGGAWGKLCRCPAEGRLSWARRPNSPQTSTREQVKVFLDTNQHQ